MIVASDNSIRDDSTLKWRLCINAARSAAATYDFLRKQTRANDIKCGAGDGRGAGIIPGYLMDIAQCRLSSHRGIGCAPETGLCGCRRKVVEIGSADGHVERRRSNATHSKAESGYGCGVEIVATGGTRVSRRDHHGDSLGGCLFPYCVEECVARCAQSGFTFAETLAHHIGTVVVDDVYRGEINSGRRQRVF